MYFGIDVGRGYLKISDQDSEVYKFPSFVSRGAEQDLELNGMEFQGNEQALMDNLKVTINGQKYFMGELARKWNGTREFEKNKTNHENTIPLAITGIALASIDDVIIPKIVVGLPIVDYKKQARTFEEKLVGTYEVELPHKTVTIIIKIENVRAFPEGAGAIYDLILDPKGQITNPDLAQSNVAVLDIGWKTANYVVLKSMVFDDAMSGTLQQGMSSAFKPFYKRISREMDVTMAEAEKMLGDYGKLEIKDLAKTIKDELALFWRDGRGLTIYVAGGGGTSISEYLNYKHTLIYNAQDSNAKGFMKVAKMIWQK